MYLFVFIKIGWFLRKDNRSFNPPVAIEATKAKEPNFPPTPSNNVKEKINKNAVKKEAIIISLLFINNFWEVIPVNVPQNAAKTITWEGSEENKTTINPIKAEADTALNWLDNVWIKKVKILAKNVARKIKTCVPKSSGSIKWKGWSINKEVI